MKEPFIIIVEILGEGKKHPGDRLPIHLAVDAMKKYAKIYHECEVLKLNKADVSGLLGEWEKGYKEGWEAATTNAIAEIRKNYSPNSH